jgi:Holliday junction resolvase
MKESILQHKIINDLEKRGYIVVKTVVLSKAGFPDIMAFRNGKTLFIEVKKTTGVHSELQKYRQKQLIEQNFDCWLIRTLDEFKMKVNLITK